MPEPLFPGAENLLNGHAAAFPMPTHKDLPETDGKPVENMYESPQGYLLTSIFKRHLDRKHPDGQYVTAADSGIYWMAAKQPLEGCKSPDWYYIPGVPRLLEGEFRRSYVMWKEHVPPAIVIEFVSGTGAEEHDVTPGWGKFWIYERRIQAEYYAIWDPKRNKLEVYQLEQGRYRCMKPDAKGRYNITSLDARIGVWEGSYLGDESRWLRAWDSRGRLLPSFEETASLEKQRAENEKQRAETEKQRAENEKQRAENEKQRADKLAAKLRELGVDPTSI